MAKYLAHRASAKSVTVFFYDKEPVTISSDNSMYPQIRQRLSSGQYKSIDQLLDKATFIKTITKGKFSIVKQNGEDRIILHGSMLPVSMTKYVIDFVDNKLNTDYIQNPSETSRESLWDWIHANHLTLTDDGCFIGYRAIKANFTDIRTGLMDNSIGKVVQMSRKDVCDDRKTTCAAGLHVAAWDYAFNTYGGGSNGNIVVACKVNPRDVVAVPNDYNNQKMRVCEFTVIQKVDKSIDKTVYTDANTSEQVHKVKYVEPSDNEPVVLDSIQLSVKSDKINIPKKFVNYLLGQGSDVFYIDGKHIVPTTVKSTSNSYVTIDKDGMMRVGKSTMSKMTGGKLDNGDSVLVTAIDHGNHVSLEFTE